MRERNALVRGICVVGIGGGLAIGLGSCSNTPVQEARKPAQDHARMAMAALPVATLQQCQQNGPLSNSASTDQANKVFAVIGNRGQRVHHALWHAARGGFSKAEDQEVMKGFGPDWVVPTSASEIYAPTSLHMYCTPNAPGADWKASNYNPVGEDFLYMHHQMVGIIRGAMLNAKPALPCLAGWTSVQDSARDPLPGGKEATGAKSDATFQQLLIWDKYFQGQMTVTTGCPTGKTSCNWLETVSLSQLGMALELTTHNNLHMRYATDDPPTDFAAANKSGGAPLPLNNVFPADWIYDQQGYDWLADPYGAAVNPIFWKIHGYVDGTINTWLAANGFKSIAEDCSKEVQPCYEWKGMWAPPAPDSSTAEPEKMGVSQRPGAAGPDATTLSFNRDRMLKQWHGVLGTPKWAKPGEIDAPSVSLSVSKKPGRGAPSPAIPSDPFQYALKAEKCGS